MGLRDMNMAESLIRALGIDPQQVQDVFAEGKAEFEAMKLGFGNAMSYFRSETAAIREQQNRIEAKLDMLLRLTGDNAFPPIALNSEGPNGEKSNGQC
jgi:hypothetical protein